MIEPKDIIKKGQMDNFKKVISRLENEARYQAIEDEIKWLEILIEMEARNKSRDDINRCKYRIEKLKRELDKNG